jgi:DNA-binding response OmpR family regulator
MDSPGSVLIVDDDQLYGDWAVATLAHQGGLRAVHLRSVDQGLDACRTGSYDLVIIDLRMPHGSAFTAAETAGGASTGLAFARSLRRQRTSSTLLIQSQEPDPRVERSFAGDDKVHTARKTWDPNELLLLVDRLLGPRRRKPHVFIVHGRDDHALLELKNFLQNRLELPEPTILREQPSGTATVLQKFEEYAQRADVVFVMLTPDDRGRLAAGAARTGRARARQNVLFELGYFLCFTRQHGRPLIVLSKGDLELPSDIAGLVTIDITHGVESAAEAIRRELDPWKDNTPQ